MMQMQNKFINYRDFSQNAKNFRSLRDRLSELLSGSLHHNQKMKSAFASRYIAEQPLISSISKYISSVDIIEMLLSIFIDHAADASH
jgi:hypothetical protein